MGVKKFAAKVNREIEFVFVLIYSWKQGEISTGNKEKPVPRGVRSHLPWDTFKACQYLNTNKFNYFTLKEIQNKEFYWKLHAALKRTFGNNFAKLPSKLTIRRQQCRCIFIPQQVLQTYPPSAPQRALKYFSWYLSGCS